MYEKSSIQSGHLVKIYPILTFIKEWLEFSWDTANERNLCRKSIKQKQEGLHEGVSFTYSIPFHLDDQVLSYLFLFEIITAINMKWSKRCPKSHQNLSCFPVNAFYQSTFWSCSHHLVWIQSCCFKNWIKFWGTLIFFLTLSHSLCFASKYLTILSILRGVLERRVKSSLAIAHYYRFY